MCHYHSRTGLPNSISCPVTSPSYTSITREVGGNDLIIWRLLTHLRRSSFIPVLLCEVFRCVFYLLVCFCECLKAKTKMLKAVLIDHFTRNTTVLQSTYYLSWNHHICEHSSTSPAEETCTVASLAFSPSSFVYILRDAHPLFSPCKGRDISGINVCIAMVT